MRLSIASLRRRRRPREERAESARLNHPGLACCACVGRRLVGQIVGAHHVKAHVWLRLAHRIDQCAACYLLRRRGNASAEERAW